MARGIHKLTTIQPDTVAGGSESAFADIDIDIVDNTNAALALLRLPGHRELSLRRRAFQADSSDRATSVMSVTVPSGERTSIVTELSTEV